MIPSSRLSTRVSLRVSNHCFSWRWFHLRAFSRAFFLPRDLALDDTQNLICARSNRAFVCVPSSDGTGFFFFFANAFTRGGPFFFFEPPPLFLASDISPAPLFHSGYHFPAILKNGHPSFSPVFSSSLFEIECLFPPFPGLFFPQIPLAEVGDRIFSLLCIDDESFSPNRHPQGFLHLPQSFHFVSHYGFVFSYFPPGSSFLRTPPVLQYLPSSKASRDPTTSLMTPCLHPLFAPPFAPRFAHGV